MYGQTDKAFIDEFMDIPLACPITDVAPLLPHSGRMVLIDRITDYGPGHLTAAARVKENHILLKNNYLPCLAGIEIMAQGVGALMGCHARNAGEPVKLGFLLGTRKLNLFADKIPVGTGLEIRVQESMMDAGGFGVFDCSLHWTDTVRPEESLLPADGLLVEAALNAYSPPEGKMAYGG